MNHPLCTPHPSTPPPPPTSLSKSWFPVHRKDRWSRWRFMERQAAFLAWQWSACSCIIRLFPGENKRAMRGNKNNLAEVQMRCHEYNYLIFYCVGTNCFHKCCFATYSKHGPGIGTRSLLHTHTHTHRRTQTHTCMHTVQRDQMDALHQLPESGPHVTLATWAPEGDSMSQ